MLSEQKARLQEILQENDFEMLENAVWESLVALEGTRFKTVKGLEFTYTIKGYELFVDRKEKSITRSTIRISLQKVMELERIVKGPKKIGTFGASYIYPIFQDLGLIIGK